MEWIWLKKQSTFVNKTINSLRRYSFSHFDLICWIPFKVLSSMFTFDRCGNGCKRVHFLVVFFFVLFQCMVIEFALISSMFLFRYMVLEKLSLRLFTVFSKYMRCCTKASGLLKTMFFWTFEYTTKSIIWCKRYDSIPKN